MTGEGGGNVCVSCHGHEEGTEIDKDMSYPWTGGSGEYSQGRGTTAPHSTHTEWDADDKRGPRIYCNSCHDITDIPAFNSGTDSNGDGRIDLSETDVCDICHSPGGAFNGVNTTGASIGAKENWHNGGVYNNGTSLKPGKENWCVGCHDEIPSQIKTETAPNKVGNNSTYGFFVSGHGKAAGNYTTLSWQDTTASGNPGANRTCVDCHNGAVFHIISGPNPAGSRLKAGYENDSANSNCSNCHKAGGLATAAPIWYTDVTAFEFSAHGKDTIMHPYTSRPIYCSDCHDVHGTVNPAMTTANQETLCYECHTEGGVVNDAIANNRTGGYKSADDIQEAFSKSEIHNLGTSFSNGGKTYTLECISCHNVHLVTGKYWDAEQNLSPITRPSNRNEVWGDDATEKMDYYAQTGGYGTGGFYRKIAEGYTLGSGGLPFDQGGVYQPPKDGSGMTGFEFDGDVLPAYSAFCLDCHSERVSAVNPPINWGQGIGCTDNSVDPPNQRVECGARHGFGIAGTPFNMNESDPLASSFWGDGGSPDALFKMNEVSRGRGGGHFMRWPFDSAERNAGINFVMACTDCHEAHGSNRGSMIRERFQVNKNGACGSGTSPGENCTDGGNWNSFCNACHYFYGGHHAGMSCGNASCHEVNSLHRIIHSGSESGSGTQLHLTERVDVNNYFPPDFTPEIESVVAPIGSDKLYVTFRESEFGMGTPGIFTLIDESDLSVDTLSGALQPGDFWLIDKNDDNPRAIVAVEHTAGDTIAVLTMSQPTIAADLGADFLAAQPLSIWAWYKGGYNNLSYTPTALPAQLVSAGPWPATLTGPPDIISVLYGGLQLKLNGTVNSSNQVYVTFAEGAYANPDGSGNLLAEGFVLSCGWTISSVTHTAGDNFAILTMSAIVDQSDIGVCTVAAAPDAIYGFYGNPVGTGAVTFSLPPEASVNDLILKWDFNEGMGAVADSTGALGTQEDMHGVLTRNVQWVTSTKPGTAAGDKAVRLDRVSDRGAVQLNYTINPDDGLPPATYNSGGAPVIVQEMQQSGEFSFSVWIKPTALGCSEGQTLGLNTKLRRDILTTQFWIKNWALGIMRFSDDGNPISGNCSTEDSTHDVLRFWVSVGDPADPRCDPWGGTLPAAVLPVSPAGYYQGGWITGACGSGSSIMPTTSWTHAFAQTETAASGAPTYGGVALQPGQWQHVVGTWDGRYIRIYINGQLAAETDMGGSGNYIMLSDPHLWGGNLPAGSRHVSSFFAVGARPIWSTSGTPSAGYTYWNANGFYDLNNLTYVGELDDVKYWKSALPLTTIQY
ncbi:MAG: hypothetical protein OEV42_11180 [Deltaproteobacteria bacterium]|nr:hypothetical protein [Deltaproteobacteria bacterium]